MNKFNGLLLLAFFTLATLSLVTADPFGATNVSQVATSRAVSGTAANHSALAGNVTEITVSGNSITQSWQGYYGNVSGGITLENSAGNVMYNWSSASPQGEIYASNASSVTWSSIACYNVSADNATALETFYGIGANDADGVNETFSNATNHDAFTTAAASFFAGACYATNVYSSTGPVAANFQEVLLTDGSKHVFVALLEQNQAGFDSAQHDFEMLVLENGHAGDVSTTPYFFYVELN